MNAILRTSPVCVAALLLVTQQSSSNFQNSVVSGSKARRQLLHVEGLSCQTAFCTAEIPRSRVAIRVAATSSFFRHVTHVTPGNLLMHMLSRHDSCVIVDIRCMDKKLQSARVWH